MTKLSELRAQLARHADPAQAAVYRRFFKTGKGEYGEGDRFIGVKVPVIRKLARGADALGLADTSRLLRSPIHEERTLALVLLVRRYQRGDRATRAAIFEHYLASTRYINNWDLVDVSAPYIVGGQLLTGDRRLLRRLARSSSIWERRIAMLATFAFIRAGDASTTYELAERLLGDRHDLIHKAVGWMLREAGVRVSQASLQRFLQRHAGSMPRTMLRYAIERLPLEQRQEWLRAGRILADDLTTPKERPRWQRASAAAAAKPRRRRLT